MLFSIVIPTYKRPALLRECLNCLSTYFEPTEKCQFGPELEVIVTDDHNDVELHDQLNVTYPWCRFLNGPQRGPAANRNHGANYAVAEWIVFTDDDCLPQPGWLEAYAASASACEVMEGRTSALGEPRRVDEECPINETGGFLWSCNFAIKRDIFNAIGGFDEFFPAPCMEDVELRIRLKKLGYKALFVPNAVVFHPWRIRKGLSHVKAHALSVGRFTELHSEQAPDFSPTYLFKYLIRTTLQRLSRAYALRTVNGLLRETFLNICSIYFISNAVNRSSKTSII